MDLHPNLVLFCCHVCATCACDAINCNYTVLGLIRQRKVIKRQAKTKSNKSWKSKEWSIQSVYNGHKAPLFERSIRMLSDRSRLMDIQAFTFAKARFR